MHIYKRTASGNEAALNSKSALPRKLRTLLIAVDGKTPLSTYVNSLSSFGDVAALLDSLVNAGLVELASSSLARKDDSPVTPAVASQGVLARFGNAFRGKPELSSALAAQAFSADRPQPPLPSAYLPASGRNDAPPVDDGYRLRKAISLMSDFVTQHLPAQSLEIVLAFEDLGSVEQVMASLNGYEALIAQVGEPARGHLAELRRMLAAF